MTRAAPMVHIKELAMRAQLKRVVAIETLRASSVPYSQAGHDYWVPKRQVPRILALLKARRADDARRRKQAFGIVNTATIGEVYFIACDGFVKIGYGFHPRNRMGIMQVGCPHRMELLLSFPADMEDELHYHQRFAELRHRGEWFRLEGPLLAFINDTAGRQKSPSGFTTDPEFDELEAALNQGYDDDSSSELAAS